MFEKGVNLNRVQLFIEIVRLGSISKTASLLRLQKSKVSRDLALLEQELGTQLIYRTTRQFNLTLAGQSFYEKALTSLQLLHEAINEASTSSKSISGHISITSPEDIGQIVLIPLLEEFSKRYPGVSYNIDFSTEVIDLVNHKVDLAIRPGNLKDSSLKMKKVGKIEFGLFCSETFYESLHKSVTAKELSALPTIYFRRNSGPPHWNLLCGRKRVKVSLTPVVEVNNFLAALQFVKKGLGIGLLPKFIIENEKPKNELIPILKEFTTASTDIQILWPQQKEELVRVKVLSDFLAKKMRPLF